MGDWRKSIMLLVTYGCNLRCSYCYEPKRTVHQMSFDTAKDAILRNLSTLSHDYNSVEIQFMGGEPFMAFSLIKRISEWIWEEKPYNLHYDLFAQTNGTLVCGEIKDWLLTNKHRFSIGLSYDGTLEMQRENRHSMPQSVDLEFFATNWPEQNMKMTVSPNTIDNLFDGVIFLHNAGFKHIAADLAMGKSVNWRKEHLVTYRNQLEKLVEYYSNHLELEPFSQLRLNIFSLPNQNRNVAKTCSCGEDLVCVDWDGEEYACHLFAPITLPIERAKESQKIDFANHELFISSTCKKCSLNIVCNHCYGMNYLCTGSVTTPSPFHCNAFKIRYAANIKLLYANAHQLGNSEVINSINNLLKQL